MNTIGSDNRGTITRGRFVWHVQNALVEEVHTDSENRTGYLLVSYAVRGQHNTTYIELLRLNVTRNTLIRNQIGLPVCLCDIRPGMWVDADFPPILMPSSPPQTNAFQIVVLRRTPNPQPPVPPRPPRPPQPPTRPARTDRIISVDPRNGSFLIGDPRNINDQMRFVVTNETVILDRNGRRISLRELRPGQLVEVTHAEFQTASIPPQSTAYRVQVLNI